MGAPISQGGPQSHKGGPQNVKILGPPGPQNVKILGPWGPRILKFWGPGGPKMGGPYFHMTPFVCDLVLAKSVAVGKTPRQALLFDCLLYWPHIAWARCHHYETGPSPDFSPRLRDKIWEWPGDEASYLL